MYIVMAVSSCSLRIGEAPTSCCLYLIALVGALRFKNNNDGQSNAIAQYACLEHMPRDQGAIINMETRKQILSVVFVAFWWFITVSFSDLQLLRQLSSLG